MDALPLPKFDPPTMVQKVQTAPKALQVVPPGHHAHVRLDGTVVIHGNENLGNAAAHAGIARPWVRTAEAGQVVRVAAPAFRTYTLPCPDGRCPLR